MKKIILSLLVAIICLSTFMLTSCNDNNNAGTSTGGGFSFGGTSDSTFYENSTNSDSVSTSNAQNSTTSQTDTTSTGNNSTVPNNSTPTQGSFGFSYTNSGDSYTVPQTTVDPILSANVQAAVRAINNIGTVTYTKICLNKIQFAEQMINNAGGSASVPNYNDYVQARNSYDSIAVSAFAQLVDSLETNFSVNANFKAGLDEAVELYNSISSTKKADASTAYAKLTSLKTRYTNEAYAAEIMLIVNALPQDSATASDEYKNEMRELKMLYQAATTEQKALVHANNGAEAKITAYITKLDTTYPEYDYVVDIDRESATPETFFSGLDGLSDTGDGGPIDYNGTPLSRAYQIGDATITFTAQAEGILTLYVLCHGSDNGLLSIKLNGSEIDTVDVGCDEGPNASTVFKYEVIITGSGTITITKAAASVGDALNLFAIVFF